MLKVKTSAELALTMDGPQNAAALNDVLADGWILFDLTGQRALFRKEGNVPSQKHPEPPEQVHDAFPAGKTCHWCKEPKERLSKCSGCSLLGCRRCIKDAFCVACGKIHRKAKKLR